MPRPSLHCPACRALLPGGGATYACPSCRATYPDHDGLPVLVAARFLDAFKSEEQHFHDDLSASVAAGSVSGRNSSFHWRYLRPMLDLPAGSAILEVACGTRADGIELAQAGLDVTAIDLAPEAAERARDLARRSGVGTRMRFLAADAEHLPFVDRVFDATFVAASFHHFPHQLAALQELQRVTRPGGYVIWGVEPASWPYRTIYRLLAPVKRLIRRRRPRSHHSVADDTTEGYTGPGIQQLFAAAGLVIVRIEQVKFLGELYDSSLRLASRLTGKTLQPFRALDRGLARVDDALAVIPGLTRCYWHFNVISRVPDQSNP